MLFYRGIPIYVDEGEYTVGDTDNSPKFPTETEAKEYIDDELGF